MDMLGEEIFFKALHHYIRTWNGKHPVPLDFFNCMNTGSGIDLNWFWKRWFYDNGFPDLAIGKVTQKGKNKKVTIVSKGNKPVPLDLLVIFDDGSSVKFHRSIEVWKEKSNTTLAFKSTKKIKEIRLGSTYVADIDKSDNKLILK
jgi:aminopeptidase N